MQIEVTEKEAHGIYSQRYLDLNGGRRSGIIFGVSAIITIVAFFFISKYCATYFLSEWLALSAGVLMIPAFLHTIKLSRASGKYAREKIGEVR